MKNKLLKSAIVILLFAFAQNVVAQNEKELKKLVENGDEYFRIEEYHNALPFFLDAVKLNPDNGEINYKIGVCYLYTVYKAEALSYFEKSLNSGHAPIDIHFELARLYHLTHNFNKALDKYEESKKYIGKGTSSDPIHYTEEEVDRYMDMCEYGKILVKTPLDYTIENMGEVINSDKRDHVPVVSADETTMIFTSRREGTTGGGIDYLDGLYFEDIYISQKENGVWNSPKNIGDIINTKSHDASVGLSPDGQKLFIYKTGKGTMDQREGNLYESDWNGEIWSKPVKMQEGINSAYVEPCASIVSNENTMYFSSDRPGGKGGLDIYSVKKLPNGLWAKPQNLDQINTPYDDDAPFIHSDNRTLYFSSKGHKTMGGFDIFMTVLNEETDEWSEPQNMGYPLNTAGDDIYFVWSADGERGYFSSFREDSHGDLDIYVVHRPVTGKFFMVFKGTVLDEDTRKPVAASIVFFDETASKLVGVYNTDAEKGRFNAIIPPNHKYKVIINASGYEEVEEIVKTPDVKEYFEQEDTFYVKRAQAAAIDTIPDERPMVGEIFALNNVYFDFDKAILRPESMVDLDKAYAIMEKFPGIKVEVGAHTDSKGNDDYNLKLSERRAKSVVDYLVEKGIAIDRLIGKAYGESNPVDTNETDEGRQKNRRVEIKVVESKRK